MKPFDRISIIVSSLIQLVWSSYALLLYLRQIITLDCDNLVPYTLHTEIQVCENCYLNYLTVFHTHLIVYLIAFISSFLLFFKRRIGWIGSFFVNLVLSIMLISFAIIEGFSFRSNEVFILMFLIMGTILTIILAKRSIRDHFNVKSIHFLFIGLLILVLFFTNLFMFNQFGIRGYD